MLLCWQRRFAFVYGFIIDIVRRLTQEEFLIVIHLLFDLLIEFRNPRFAMGSSDGILLDSMFFTPAICMYNLLNLNTKKGFTTCKSLDFRW